MNRAAKGCSNFGGAAAARLEYCRNSTMELFGRYGYQPFSPAEFQLAEDVWQNLSPACANRLIPFMSPYGEPCVLRGDLTLSAASYLASHFESDERPLRLSYAERVFSVPLPPKTNLEENQVGIELIGWEDAGADAEVVSLLFRALDRLSIEKSAVVLGDASVTAHLFGGMGRSGALLVSALQKGSYTEYLHILDKTSPPQEQEALLRALPYLRGDAAVIDEASAMCVSPQIFQPLKNLCSVLNGLGYSERVKVDLSFVRDLGYYSGPIFNAYCGKTNALLGGGGRYDGLLGQLGIDGQAAGFALNIKELAERCTENCSQKRVMVRCGANAAAALRYADALCRKGVTFELSWNKDKSESARLAALRGCCWLVDYETKSAVKLASQKTFPLAVFESEAC